MNQYSLLGEELEMVRKSGSIADMNASEQAVEARNQHGLPAIAGLDANVSEADRMKIYDLAIARQYRAFVALHGSAFGEDIWSEDKAPTSSVSGRSVHEGIQQGALAA